MIMPKKPLSLMNCQTSGGRSARRCVISQSSSIAHNCSTSLSRNACSLALREGLGKARSLFQFGLPLNNSPSHHTVPASIASCSVAEICGRILRKMLSTAPLTRLRRRKGIPNNMMNNNSAAATPCSTVSEKLAWIAITGTITIIANTQLVIEARENASRMKIANAARMVNAMTDALQIYFLLYCRTSDTLLVELLAIRLGEQTTLAKSLVMAQPAVCGRRCDAATPAPAGSAAPCRGRTLTRCKQLHNQTTSRPLPAFLLRLHPIPQN